LVMSGVTDEARLSGEKEIFPTYVSEHLWVYIYICLNYIFNTLSFDRFVLNRNLLPLIVSRIYLFTIYDALYFIIIA
jgi:hypothetical protein